MLSSVGDSLDLELHLSPATLRAPCLRGNGCLLSLRRPTFGAIKTRGCSPVMAAVFLAQVRLNLALGTMSEFFFSPILIGIFSSSSSLSTGFSCFHWIAIASY